MTNSDRTLNATELDLVSGGLRDRPDQDRLNRQNRMDGGGWGAAIGGNLMMGGKDAHDPTQIGNQIPVDF
jgi:hypothetical protein